jgi:hypothetical protein
MAEDWRMEKIAGRLWRALREHATHWAVGGLLIAATGFAPEEWFARTDEALAALRDAQRISPSSFQRFVTERVPWIPEKDYAHILDGLRKAGWQG